MGKIIYYNVDENGYLYEKESSIYCQDIELPYPKCTQSTNKSEDSKPSIYSQDIELPYPKRGQATNKAEDNSNLLQSECENEEPSLADASNNNSELSNTDELENSELAYTVSSGENSQNEQEGEPPCNTDQVAIKKPFFRRFVDFLNTNWLYFASPIIIFSLFMAVLFAYDVYPFSHTSMSNYDLLAQICPFLEHFYDVVEGKSSLFYTNTVAGGADIFGTLAYCAVSPFTFLFFICGKGNVYYAVSFVLPIKLCCIAISAIYFIKKSFKNIPEHFILIISILYAYCGYMFVANTYINWVDFLIYMPFVIMGFEKLVKEGKIKNFAISYALMIYTCFSIACFALLLVFLVFVAYVLIVPKGADRWKILTRMCISLVCAVALALPIMVPALLAYMKSGRNTGLFENIMNPINFNHLDAKLSYIISDSLLFVLTVIYFIKTHFKRPIDRFLFVTGVIIMMPVLIDEVCNLLNAGSYMSYALRFGFLNAAYMLYVGCRLLNDIKEKKPRNDIVNVFTSVLYLAITSVAVVFIINFNNSVIDDKKRDFSSLFAHSLGGLDVIAPIAGVIAALVIIGAILYLTRLTHIKVISFVLIAVCAVQVAFYNIHLVNGNTFNPVRYDQYNTIFKQVEEEYEDGNSYYRIKDYDDAITNAVFATHTDSYSVFSSVIDRTNFAAPTFFGYDGNGINVIKSQGGLFLGDALFGYKYYFIHNDQKIHKSQSRSYNELLNSTQQSYFAAARNNLCFPNAYYVKSGDLVFDGSYYDNLQKLYNFLGGEGELFEYTTTAELGSVRIEAPNMAHPDSWMVKVYMVQEGQWYFDYDYEALKDYDIYYTFNTYNEANRKALDGRKVEFGYHAKALSTYHYIHLKAYGDKELNEEVIAAYCGGRCLPLSKIQKLKTLLEERQATYKIIGGDKFDINVTTDSEGCYLFMNRVAIDGFDIKVNGQKREFVENGLNFMIVPLDSGENHVVIEYHPPYIKLMLVGVLLGLIILAIMYLLTRPKPMYKLLTAIENLFGKKGDEKAYDRITKIDNSVWGFTSKVQPKVYSVMSKIISVAAIILAVGVLGFFIAYPSGVFFVKLFKLIFKL